VVIHKEGIFSISRLLSCLSLPNWKCSHMVNMTLIIISLVNQILWDVLGYLIPLYSVDSWPVFHLWEAHKIGFDCLLKILRKQLGLVRLSVERLQTLSKLMRIDWDLCFLPRKIAIEIDWFDHSTKLYLDYLFFLDLTSALSFAISLASFIISGRDIYFSIDTNPQDLQLAPTLLMESLFPVQRKDENHAPFIFL